MVGEDILGREATSGNPQDFHFHADSHRYSIKNSADLPKYPLKAIQEIMGRHACVIILLAVCALWSIGEALSCDQCGRECVNSCGTRQFRACCFNNLKKRVPDLGFKLWMAPPRYTGHLHLIYDA